MRYQSATLGSFFRRGVLIVLFCTPLTVCFAGDVQWVVGKDADFAHYKTYQWLPTRILTKTGLVEDEPDTTPIVKAAVNRQLAAKGLQQVDTGGDLLVSTMITTDATAQVEALIFPGTIAYHSGAAPIATVGRYNRRGTLAVNLIDARTQESAWVCMATKSIDNKAGAGQKKIPQATADIFKKYPRTK